MRETDLLLMLLFFAGFGAAWVLDRIHTTLRQIRGALEGMTMTLDNLHRSLETFRRAVKPDAPDPATEQFLRDLFDGKGTTLGT